MERDRFMSPIQAKEYGLIDSVVERRAEGTVKSA
jgi:ATP-dependent Clp protease protease subunit